MKGHAKRRPLANPFENFNLQSSPPADDFERLDSNEQTNYGSLSYSPERTTAISFSPDQTNYNYDGEYERQSSIAFNDSYQQNTRSVDMRDQSNYSREPSEDFAGFAPGAQALQVPVAKANSVLGTVFGFASMFMGNNQGNNGRQSNGEYDEENEPPLLEGIVSMCPIVMICRFGDRSEVDKDEGVECAEVPEVQRRICEGGGYVRTAVIVLSTWLAVVACKNILSGI